MNLIKLPLQLIAVTCAIAVILFGSLVYPPAVRSQRTEPINNAPHQGQIRFVQPPLLPQDRAQLEDRGASEDRKGAGKRGRCPKLNSELTALVPLTEGSPHFVQGLTVAEYPTFWFYVPYPPEDISQVKFVLLDENDRSVTPKPLDLHLSGTPGVVSVSLPSTAKPLEIGKYYYWKFRIFCDPQDSSDNITVEGTIKRIALNSNLTSQIQNAQLRDRIAFYAANGIWHDAITLLAEDRRTHSQNTDWIDLLKSIGLEDLASVPIVTCCTPAPK